jgi:hypothetical protein
MRINTSNVSTLILLFVLVAAIIILGPFAVIWAINALFPTVMIPYTLETYAASVIICSVFGVGKLKNN